jgi:hypothetical protein
MIPRMLLPGDIKPPISKLAVVPIGAAAAVLAAAGSYEGTLVQRRVPLLALPAPHRHVVGLL